MASLNSQLKKFNRELASIANELTRHTAVEIMNELAEAGPEYSGDFKDSWVAVPFGANASGTTGGGFPYTINDIPVLSSELRESRRAKKLSIENTQPYAEFALDLKEGVFRGDRKGNFPVGTVVSGPGSRPVPGIRGDVSSGKGTAISTAKKDWYVTFVKGGKMQKAMERGVRAGIKAL